MNRVKPQEFKEFLKSLEEEARVRAETSPKVGARFLIGPIRQAILGEGALEVIYKIKKYMGYK